MLIYFAFISFALVSIPIFGNLSFKPAIDQKLTNFDPIILFDEFFENSSYFISKGALIGKGSFKEVYEISISDFSAPIALIQPHLDRTDKIRSDLKRELLTQSFLANQMIEKEYMPSFLKGLRQPKHRLTPQVFLISLSNSDQSKTLFNFALIERMDISLDNWVNSNKITLNQALSYCLEFVDLMVELHEIGLAHGDFHIKNIGIDQVGKLRLLDLGASGPGIPEQRTENDLPEDTGWDENPAAYFAPEIRRPLSDSPFRGWMTRTSFAGDIYSCAYAICEMIVGPELFLEIEKANHQKAQINHMQFIFNDGETLETKLQNKLSLNSSLIKLLIDAFSINVIDRPSMKEFQLGLLDELSTIKFEK